MRIDPNLRGQIPSLASATPWSGDGHKGWKVSLPGGRPLATPAIADGRLFLGGGFGSYEFYALDAITGDMAWAYQTEDDGPTAAVVSAGFVAFNTESCELEVLTIDGKPVWKKWLGDPLMSMPAIADGLVFQVFPFSRGDRRHYLGCFDLATGDERWKQPLNGEIITAPILASERVHVTCLDGTVACFRQSDGKEVWKEAKQATSSPMVFESQCYFAQRRETEVPYDEDIWELQQLEELCVRGIEANSATIALPATTTTADYLDLRKRRRGSSYYQECETSDASVGFSHAKGDSKMEQAHANLGHGHVSSLWAYQGSRPFVWDGKLYSALGDTLHCVDPGSKEVVWKQRVYESQGEVLDSVMTPPAAVNGKLFVGSIRGEVCCLSARTGDVLWRVQLGEPVQFQPALANGRLYAATARGNLYCIETGDSADDGWSMWGATAAHNGGN